MIASEYIAGTPIPPFDPISLSNVFAKGTPIKLGANELLYMPEEQSTHVYLVVSGEIRLYNINADGREFTLGVFGENEIVGECELLTDSLRSGYAMARVGTELLALEKKHFLNEFQESAELAMMLTRIVSFKNRLAERKMESLLFKSAHAKVAEQLLALAEQHGQLVDSPGGERVLDIAYPITHQEIANLIGATRETVSYVLLDFKALEMILTSRRRIAIRDVAKLKEIARS
ncbi:MAG: Crp/Fnr family transcriptional regulator [SAR324 cluster bacterium]|nr:Crp/Fnr family transcriptional regulator [SAR324 cluster bacterium]